MTRRGRIEKKKIQPDFKYQSILIQKFINKIMLDGKKSKAENIVYRSLDLIAEKSKKDPYQIFEQAIKNVTPLLEVKSRRVGGSTYQVPIEVPLRRGISLALGWIRGAARNKAGKSMIEKLAGELLDASNNTGISIKKREDLHKTAESNKAFAHFRW